MDIVIELKVNDMEKLNMEYEYWKWKLKVELKMNSGCTSDIVLLLNLNCESDIENVIGDGPQCGQWQCMWTAKSVFRLWSLV